MGPDTPPRPDEKALSSMKKQRVWLTTVFVLVSVSLPSRGLEDPGQSLALARDGRSRYRVVVARDCSPQVRAVAEDFVQVFAQMTGVTLPLATDATKRLGYEILIGPSAHVEELMLGVDLSRFRDEEYLITTVDMSLILLGGRRRGTPNAVYTFLDEMLGCRWYAPDCSVIPQKPTLEIERLYVRRRPAFKRRCVFLANASRPQWAARVRLNGFIPGVRCANNGTTITWPDFRDDAFVAGSWFPACTNTNNDVHTLAKNALLTEADARERPEYFALIDGKRKPGAQICYAHPDSVALVSERAKRWLKMCPWATHISISQADSHDVCQCERCKEAGSRFTYPQHRTPAGHLTRPDYEMAQHVNAGLVMKFVNAVAREIAKDYPDIPVHTISYNTTLNPPNEVLVEPNVIVEYACISACYYHTFSTCAYNEGLQPFWSELQRWCDKAEHVWVWWYDIYLPIFHPVPMLAHWRENLLEWRDVGVEGVTIQANQISGWLDEQWLQHLRAYVYAKTMWDPTRDVWELAAEFCSGYYGAAAQPMLAYVRETQEPASYQGTGAVHCARRPGFHQASTPTNLIKPDAVRRWEDLLDAAESKAAGDEQILRRIAVDRLSLDLPAMRFLPVNDPLRQRAHERFFRTAPELCKVLPRMTFPLVYGKIFDSLDKAAEHLATSPPETLAQEGGERE